MPARRLSALAYRRITGAAVVALFAIVVTGGAVRLTGSGLGCPDWPTCARGSVVPPLQYNALVESVNRTITGVVSVAVVLAALGSLLRTPRRRDLIWLSAGLVAGVVGQVVLGGLVVLFDLYPPLVMAHFGLSMLLLWCAVVLHHRAGQDPPAGGAALSGPGRPAPGPGLPSMARVLLVATAIVVLLGTVVTGSGPHPGSNGDQVVERLPFSLHAAARLHSAAVWLLVFLVVVFAVSARAARAAPEVLRRVEVVLAAVVAQGAVGYVQYFTRLPALLVGVHVAGAAGVWVAVVRLQQSVTAPGPADRQVGDAEHEPALVST